MTTTAVHPSEVGVYRHLITSLWPQHPAVDCLVMFDNGATRLHRFVNTPPWQHWARIGEKFAGQAREAGVRRVTLLQFSDDATEDCLMRHVANELIRNGILVEAWVTMHNEVTS